MHGGGLEDGVEPMYYLMPLGLALGIIVVCAFELLQPGGGRLSARTALYRKLACMDKDAVLDPLVAEKLAKWVNSVGNVSTFWCGGALEHVTREHLTKIYEMLAVVCALLFSVSVAFYLTGSGGHAYGLVCCVANCALWMATLSAAFFAATIGACEADRDVSLLVGLYGRFLMRVPMMLFVWGTLLLFIEFVLFFKDNVDAGANCSMCLGACLVVVPLFFHCMHKLAWAAAVVQQDVAAGQTLAAPPTAAEVRAALDLYVASADGLGLDLDDFLTALGARPNVRLTSTAQRFATSLFDAAVETRLQQLSEQGGASADAKATPDDEVQIRLCWVEGGAADSEGGQHSPRSPKWW